MIIQSALIGLGIGILPGIGGSTSSLLAYSAGKSASKHPEKFGTGIVDGIIASETSNNAVIGGSTEENFRQALMQTGGNWSIFVTHPISLIFLLIAVVSVAMTIKKQVAGKK